MPSAGTPIGADADELERAATELRSAASQLDGEAGALTAVLSAVDWIGGVAAFFTGQWNGTHRAHLDAAASDIRDAANRLDTQAAEQRFASRVVVVSPATPGARPRGGGGGSSASTTSQRTVVERVDEALSWLALGRTELAVVAEFAANIDDDLFARRLIEFLANPRFRELLDHSDQVLDVGAFVVDLIGDIGDNPALPFDDRLVHGITDAATRFAIAEGVGKGAEFLAAALTTSLLPVVGAVLAPVASVAAGAIAEMVVGRGVDALDGATDFVDVTADAAVEIYRDAKAVFGVVLDGVEAVVQMAGDTADLVGTAGEWIVDAGDWVGDQAGDLVDGVIGGAADVFGAGWLGIAS